jgi:hypothetical protein
MEAFISPLSFSGRFDEFSTSYEHQQQVLQPDDFRRATRRRSKELRRRASRNSRQRDSYHSRTTRATDELDDWYLRDDPFKGF